jgi:hypothetical protein
MNQFCQTLINTWQFIHLQLSSSNFRWFFSMVCHVPLWPNLYIMPPSSNVLRLSANMPQYYYLWQYLFLHLSSFLHSLSFSFTYCNFQRIFIATLFGAHTVLSISFSVFATIIWLSVHKTVHKIKSFNKYFVWSPAVDVCFFNVKVTQEQWNTTTFSNSC